MQKNRFFSTLHNLGRRKRALVLLLLGSVFFISGWVQQDTGSGISKLPQVRLSYSAHLQIMPLESWGWVFMVVGLIGGMSGFATKIPAWVGFAMLQALSTLWALLFIASWADTGYGRAWISGLTWMLVSGLLFIISDWEDPPLKNVFQVKREME